MALQHENLQNLLALAQEDSSDKRRELLEGVTDLFFADEVDMSDTETALADDILGQVSDQVEEHVRIELSQRFSGAQQAPPGLIKKLASDMIEVARPILEKSGVLSDEDLQEIIASMGSEHQVAVTKRESISEAVSDALIENGDEEVLVSLVQNEGTQISRDGMEKLVEKSEAIEELHAPLLQRQDLPADLMHDMFWFVGSALKRVIMTKTDVDEEEVNELLAKREAEFKKLGDGAASELTRAEKQVRRMARLGQLNHGALAQFLRQGDKEEFTAALAYLTEVDLNTAKRITDSPSREGMAIACRASDIDLSTFSAIALLLNEKGSIGGQMRTPAEVAILLELYNKIPLDAAKRTMRFWRVRKKSMGEEVAAPK